MSLRLTAEERIARARADLRMGVPAVLTGQDPALVVAAETVSADRLADLNALDGALDLAITVRRAETLRARAYDGDVARIAVPADADHRWIRATADPSA
ncbi:MAG: GTP cyclohydrolase II, partial [Pseudomonadota bacterium]